MPIHVSVLLAQVIEWLSPAPGGIFVDGTLGAGGHARALAERVAPGGTIVGLDRDPAAVAAAEQTSAGLPIRPVQANFCDLPEVLAELEIGSLDGILLNLGLSSDQLADDERRIQLFLDRAARFAIRSHAGRAGQTADQPPGAEHLADLIYHYGEERYSRRVARAIVEQRRERPIETAAELAELVRRCVPRSRVERIDPATRTFQALRIAVNDELKSLEIALRRLPGCLRPGGRLAIISFHSLEDRPVKDAFRSDPRLRSPHAEADCRRPGRAGRESAFSQREASRGGAGWLGRDWTLAACR